MSELAFRSATELAGMIAACEIFCREMLEHHLSRIERLNPRINAIVTVDAERARNAADEADGAITWASDANLCTACRLR